MTITDEMIAAREKALQDHTDRYMDGSEVVGSGAVLAIYEAMSALRTPASGAVEAAWGDLYRVISEAGPSDRQKADAVSKHLAALTSSPKAEGEAARIIACHLPLADCPDTACLPITMTAGDLRSVYAALSAPQPLQGGEVTRFAAALKVMRERALELTKKHGDPNGTDYEQGVNDHGHRWLTQIDDLLALISPARREGED